MTVRRISALGAASRAARGGVRDGGCPPRWRGRRATRRRSDGRGADGRRGTGPGRRARRRRTRGRVGARARRSRPERRPCLLRRLRRPVGGGGHSTHVPAVPPGQRRCSGAHGDHVPKAGGDESVEVRDGVLDRACTAHIDGGPERYGLPRASPDGDLGRGERPTGEDDARDGAGPTGRLDGAGHGVVRLSEVDTPEHRRAPPAHHRPGEEQSRDGVGAARRGRRRWWCTRRRPGGGGATRSCATTAASAGRRPRRRSRGTRVRSVRADGPAAGTRVGVPPRPGGVVLAPSTGRRREVAQRRHRRARGDDEPHLGEAHGGGR